jgi:hypothetical protein
MRLHGDRSPLGQLRCILLLRVDMSESWMNCWSAVQILMLGQKELVAVSPLVLEPMPRLSVVLLLTLLPSVCTLSTTVFSYYIVLGCTSY